MLADGGGGCHFYDPGRCRLAQPPPPPKDTINPRRPPLDFHFPNKLSLSPSLDLFKRILLSGSSNSRVYYILQLLQSSGG
ncbi:hypothetical protein LWI29_020410 [Acer saccharum]|uniref:Uncharacterized protein n=1 Tax=Acer saccharum TaxID=4024 RepID=A0AA39W1J4_ACESA|nr:hypothetical protein LWI29_020410 [Acer saccharum]